MIIPGVHQPTAPFELIINKGAWAKISDRDKKLIEEAAKMVTFESWTRIGHEDAKALEFYRKAGNEIIELDEKVQLVRSWAHATAGNVPPDLLAGFPRLFYRW